MKNRVTLLSFLLLSFLLFTAEGNGQTGIPRMLSYQGVLTDNLNAPVADGVYTITIRIYDAATGGALLWEEQNSVTTFDGVFSVVLGTKQPINIPFDNPYWLGIELSGEAEMVPRLPLVTSPYAFRADHARVADSLAGEIRGVVRSLNTMQGDLQIAGEGGVAIRTSGDTLYVSSGGTTLPQGTKQGDVIRWNAVAGTWEATDISVSATPRLIGDGSPGAPLDIADMGAEDGELLTWNAATGNWEPGTFSATANTSGPLTGDGSTTSPIELRAGQTAGQILYWDGTQWKQSAGAAPSDGEVLVWDAASGAWQSGRERTAISPRLSGEGTPAAPLDIARQGATQDQVLRWDAVSGAWVPGDAFVVYTPPFSGNGTSTNPLALSSGTAPGQLLFWDGNAWKVSDAPIPGDGDIIRWNQASGQWEPTTLDIVGLAPLRRGALWVGDVNNKARELAAGQGNRILTVNSGTGIPEWSSTLNVDTIDALQLRVSEDANLGGDLHVRGQTTLEEKLIANDSSVFNGPVRFSQFPGLSLTEHSILVGDASNQATEFGTTGTAGAVLQQDASGGPRWSRNIDVDTANAETLRTVGDINAGGNGTIGGDLTVNGTDVTLPNGSIDNNELANSTINLSYGTGISGDASVPLGGTLNVNNTGVTQILAGDGVSVDQGTGAVTVANTGLISATAGNGINISTTNGNATIANTGVTSLAGTTNQVSVDQTTGAVTLSLPQDIHTNASPTFDGLTLDNINNASTASQVVVSNNGSIESRSFNSLFPGGLLPNGTSANSTLRWDGNNWVENTSTTIDAGGNTLVGGDLTVGGTDVTLPNGSIDNNELANSTINLSYGTGISGDASVALGGTLNVNNTGVTQILAGDGVSVDQGTGTVTVANTGLIAATAGNGINISTTNGNATVTNTGVTSLAGTTNQVSVDQTTGAITLSLPQDIHTDASPTFDGLTLDNINNASTASQVVVSNNGSIESRSFNSLFPGGLLPNGTSANSTLRWDGNNWVENTSTTIDAGGNLSTAGNGIIGGDLTVGGTDVTLPNGSIDNNELANSTINLSYGTGISGDASVALGGTLNVNNTGVTQILAGDGVSVDQGTGTVTVANTGLIGATAGNGINISTTNGNATIANTGVTSLAGTTNQVSVDQATGAVTLSLPQDIHTDASPTFDGLTLDNLTSGSSSTDVLVSNNGVLESRTFTSLLPSGLLPNGSSANSTLRWDGNNWVENTNATIDAGGNLGTAGNGTIGGDLTVSGTNVTLPNGSIDNNELANSAINLSYGTGISGDASVTLGGTLNVNNSGVTSLAGTTNQVIVNQATGAVTLSLPQDIHTDASPTFDGITLDNLTSGSTATNVLVSNSGVVEERTFTSLIGTLPLSENALFVGNAGNTATELTSTNDPLAIMQQNGSGAPSWTSFATVVTAVRDSLGTAVWTTGGNAGTDPTNDFIGTTDDRTLVVRVNNDTAMRIVPGTVPSIISGHSANTIEPWTEGSVIAGGGDGSSPNRITASYSSIAGGLRGRISAGFSFVGGGQTNIIDTLANESVISGGYVNRIDTGASWSVIGGGYANRIIRNATRSTIGGGAGNRIDTSAVLSTIAGGQENFIGKNSYGGTIAGGYKDTIEASAAYATIGGGEENSIAFSGHWATISGGRGNTIDSTADYASISGGQNNYIGRAAYHGNIGGGLDNTIRFSSRSTTIAGGRSNTIDSTVDYATIGGGYTNTISKSAFSSTIAGGDNNTIAVSGRWATIGGGRNNTVDSTADYSVIGGGQNNYAGDGSWQSTIAGGLDNRLAYSGRWATISGGRNNTIDSTADYASIGGGQNNTVGTAAYHGHIGGGMSNTIKFSARIAAISGGRNNTIDSTADYASIGAGQGNYIGKSAYQGRIGGGLNNSIRATSANSVIAGGNGNIIDTASNASIGGGLNNLIGRAGHSSRIGGGHANKIDSLSFAGIISGGEMNRIGINADWNSISGGLQNVIDSANFSAIAGGRGLTLKGDNSFGFLANPAGNNDMIISDPDVVVFGNTDLWLANNDADPSKLKFFTQRSGEGPFPTPLQTYSSFEAPATQTSTIEYVLPDSAGIAGDVLAVKSVSGNQVSLDWAAGGSAGGSNWSRTGNGSTNPANNFIGTTDNQPLIVRVNNDTVMQYIPDGTSPIIVGGYHGNAIGTGSSGALIAGGGTSGAPNLIGSGSLYSIIGGGADNTIEDNVLYSIIAGGEWQTIYEAGEHNVISGGSSHEIMDSVEFSVIAGGTNSVIGEKSSIAVISGGAANGIGYSSSLSTIAGGNLHTIGDFTTAVTISGGSTNLVYRLAEGSTISGGYSNVIGMNDRRSTVGGGYNNRIEDNSTYTTIGGGHSNRAGSYDQYGTISGGYQNLISARSFSASIGGGLGNEIGIGTLYASINGGTDNTIGDTTQASTIGGGHSNHIDRYTDYAVITGGRLDTIESGADHSAILGGLSNKIGSTALVSTIAGGFGLTLTGSRSFGFHANSFFGTKPMEVSEGYTAVFGNTNLWLANNDSSARQLRFYEPFNSSGAFPGAAGSRAFFTSFEAPLLSDTIRYILPPTKGTAGDVLEIASVSGDVVTLEWDTDDNSSDVRFKKNIRTLSNALDSTLMLRGVRYDWRRKEFPDRHFGDGEAIGFIAQEVEEIFPELVVTESDGYKKVEYAKVTALLVEALREQQQEMRRQDDEIRELRSMVRELLDRERDTKDTSSSVNVR